MPMLVSRPCNARVPGRVGLPGAPNEALSNSSTVGVTPRHINGSSASIQPAWVEGVITMMLVCERISCSRRLSSSPRGRGPASASARARMMAQR